MSVDGPYNEHLVRDVGALNLALVVMLSAAAISLSKPMITTAAVASLTWGVPHLIYHLATTDGLDASDLTASFTGLVLFAAIPIVLIVVTKRDLTQTSAVAAQQPMT